MKRTICALATTPGISGLAIIRLSGGDAIKIAAHLFSGKNKLDEMKTHTIHYGKIVQKGRTIDTVTASIFIAPNSYTGEDCIEFGCHGGYIVADEIIKVLMDNGVVLAEPGEFTKRAFLNGKMDLTQVEAVADIIHSVSVPGCQTAARQLSGEFTERMKNLRQQLIDISGLLELELDFSEEDLEFIDKTEVENKIKEASKYCLQLAGSYKSAEILRSGYFVGIAGYPNSGKSTLFNTLLSRKRAIVSETPGTTRDYLEESIFLNGYSVKLIDTAGLRATSDTIEIEGIKFAESILKQANMIIILNDISISKDNSDNLLAKITKQFPETRVVLIQNKIDLLNDSSIDLTKSKDDEELYISAKTGEYLDSLKSLIENEARLSTESIKDVLINQRHALLLRRISEELDKVANGLSGGFENELLAIDIRETATILGEITGETWSEDVLNNIFSRFCIGK